MENQLKQSNVRKHSSMETITYLYTQFQSSKQLINQKPLFNASCSDQKLMLYDIIRAKKVNYSTKPKQFLFKLREAKRNLLNNTINEQNEYLASHKCKLENLPKGFQDKYADLANCVGNNIKIIPKSSSSLNLRSLTPKRPKEKESNVSRLKNEIMTSIEPKKIYVNEFIY